MQTIKKLIADKLVEGICALGAPQAPKAPELAGMLETKKYALEIFLELYDFNYLYWRGTLLPYKQQGLSDHVVIETSGCFPTTYFWE